MKREEAALIDEARCIGCTRCIDVCPVDAIVGAQGWMHTVVEDWCIGCALCPPACPVDCIDMVGARGAWSAPLKRAAGVARQAAQEAAGRFPHSGNERPRSAGSILAQILARKRG